MSNPTQNAVIVKSLYKSFRLPHEQSSGLKQAFLTMFRRSGKHTRGYETQHVLNDVSFEIKKGEFFGIVGRNGSGKSTLLKLLAGIYTPDKGLIEVSGSLTPFIELGVGFNPELTGRENVYLNGALLGFSRDEIRVMYDDIVAFAELEKFMDQKLKNYSSGMQVRLAFSIAIKANGDILLLDEVLAVGDEAFQKKCISYFSELKKNKQTVILVTHDMTNVERFCDRALVIDNGKLIGLYSPEKAQQIYKQLNRESGSLSSYNITKRWGEGTSKIGKIWINNTLIKQDKVATVKKRAPFQISVQTTTKSGPSEEVLFGIGIRNEMGEYIAGPNTEGKQVRSNSIIHYTVDQLPLNPGRYTLELALFGENGDEYDHILNAAGVEVIDDEGKAIYGKVDLLGKWGVVGHGEKE